NADVASGTFKMVVHNHGGGGPGADSQLISQLPVHETLASHGIIVVVIRHAGTAVARVRDVPRIIDFMLDPSQTPLAGSIDPIHVGISGFSTGGRTSLAVTGGWAAQGFAADPRIVAMVLYEPGRDNSLDDVSTISVPYLVMGGNRMENGTVTVPEVFDATELATPRIRVLHPEALHFNYQTDLCAQVDETREASLPQQVEPLTNLITLMVPNTNNCVIDPSTGLCRRVCNTGQLGLAGPPPLVGPAAFESCLFWNRGENIGPLLFPSNPFAFGGARNICNRVGVNSSQSLDDDPPPDGDGFTDAFLGGDPLIPLFEGNDFWNSNASTVELPMLHEVSLPMIKLHTVAFFKKFLEGDGRYMRYLTPGYAETQNLQAVVEIRD
ncbi:MAG TPA: hypothetical protein VJP40_04920, partial [bacterium]|nr:hypothetical protein [bacterium]